MNWKNFWETKALSGGPALQVGRVLGGKVLDDTFLAKIAARIAVQLDLQKDESLLDVCCGNGALSRALLPYCHHMIGVDFSENLIKQAQSFEKNNSGNSTNSPSLTSTKSKHFDARNTEGNTKIITTNIPENKLDLGNSNASADNDNLTTNNTSSSTQNNSNDTTDFPNNSEINLLEKALGLNRNKEEINSLENALGSDRNNEKMNLGQGLVDIGFGEKLEEQKATIKYVCGDATNFELGERFDKICLYFSFQYFESVSKGAEVLANLVKHAKPGARILLGDIPDQRKFFVYYNSPRKMSSWLKQSVTGKNDMGKFWHPDELLKICNSLSVKAYVQEQEAWQPYAKYRFDFLIEVEN